MVRRTILISLRVGMVAGLACCILSSCYALWPNTRRLPGGAYRPKWAHFRLAKEPYHLHQGDPIDTEAVYVRWDTAYHPDRYAEATFYEFLRFFQDGRVCCSLGLDSLPTNADINDLDNCQIGYYRLDGSRITLEVFSPTGAGTFVISSGRISGDTIVLGRGRRSELSYCRFKEDWMTFPTRPDW